MSRNYCGNYHAKVTQRVPADELRSISQGNQPQPSLFALAWRVNFGLHRRRWWCVTTQTHIPRALWALRTSSTNSLR